MLAAGVVVIQPLLAYGSGVNRVRIRRVGTLWFWRVQEKNDDLSQSDVTARNERYKGLLARIGEQATRPYPGWTWDSISQLKEAAQIDTDRVILVVYALCLRTGDLSRYFRRR